jgi:hypothetical protein
MLTAAAQVPVYAELTEAHITRVAEVIRRLVSRLPALPATSAVGS